MGTPVEPGVPRVPLPVEGLVTVSEQALVATLVDSVRTALAEAGEGAKAPRMQAYMKSAMPFRGVPAVPMRRICKAVLDEHRLPDRASWRRAVLALWDGALFREERYAAIELTGHRYYRHLQDPAVLDLYRHVVVTGAWWDYVDGIAANRVGPILRAAPQVVSPVLRAWATEDDLWVRRTAVLSQLGSKHATDVDLLAGAIVANLEGSRFGGEFFIRKAIGWALREHAKTDPAWVRTFVAAHAGALSGLSRREALKNLGAGTQRSTR